MEPIKITFLGTGNAIPTEKRNHSGLLLSYKDENILIDCGEGIQRQFRIAKLSPSKITKILITHWHGDHILGLPGLLQTLAMTEYKKTLDLYGPKDSKHFMSIIQELIARFKIDIRVHEVQDSIFIENKEFFIETKAMNHDSPCNAYSFVIKDKIRLDRKKLKKLKLPNSPLLGQLQAGKDITLNGKKIKAKSVSYLEPGRKVSIIMDTSLNDNAIKIASNSDVLISESSFAAEEKERALERKHLTSEDAATIAKKSKSKKLILTHLSQRYEFNPKIIEKEAKKVFKNVSLAKDFDVVEI